MVETLRQRYNLLLTGGTPAVKTGQSSNVYATICEGDQLSLFINQKLIETLTDKKFHFKEGQIGIGVSAPQSLPVDVEFVSLTVSEPK